MATIVFVLVPIFLILTVGNGWKDIKNAATAVNTEDQHGAPAAAIYAAATTAEAMAAAAGQQHVGIRHVTVRGRDK